MERKNALHLCQMNQIDERESFEELAALFGVCQMSDGFVWQEVMEENGLYVSIPDNKGELAMIGRRLCLCFLLS